jgi:hypothetical protein
MYTMKFEQSTDRLTKLFNQSIECLGLSKTKSFPFAFLLVGVVITLLSAPVQAAGPLTHDRDGQLGDTFSILLSGPYKQVAKDHGPENLGLTTVDLDDGTFSTTKIFAVSGLPEEVIGHGNGQTKKPIGNFYVQFCTTCSSAAYDLPGGAISMVFTGSNVQNVPDGQGGTYIVGTFELDIPEATGIYQSFVGGHNTMVDVLHQLADKSFVEHCICIISRPRPV